MSLDYWNADASEKEALRGSLKRLVEEHEAFLLDEQLRDAADGGVNPSRIPSWEARTDDLSVQVGSAAFAHAQRPLLAGGREGSEDGEESDKESTERADETGGFHYGDRHASFAQLLGPASFLATTTTTSSDARARKGLSSDRSRGTSSEGGTEGNAFARVMLCLASATAEMQALTQDACTAYIPPLVLFGDPSGRPQSAPGSGGEDPLASERKGARGGSHGPSSAKAPTRNSAAPSLHRQPSAAATATTDKDATTMMMMMSEEEALAGVATLMKGHMQQLWAWQQRATDLIVYTLRQLAALYSEEHCGNAKDVYVSLTEVRYTAVWHSLTDLLGAITTVEEILQQHGCFKQGYVRLRRIIAQLVAIMADAPEGDDGDDELRGGDSDRGRHGRSSRASNRKGGDADDGGGSRFPEELESVDLDSLKVLQQVVVRVGDDLLRYGKVLRVIAERTAGPCSGGGDQSESGPPYMPVAERSGPTSSPAPAGINPSENVRYGTRFRREMLEVLDYLVHNLEDAIDTPREGGHHHRLVGIVALYHLCLSLFKLSGGGSSTEVAASHRHGGRLEGNVKAAEVDACAAMGKRIFLLHHRIPIVQLRGRFSITPATWLARRQPHEVYQYLYNKPAPTPFTAASNTLVIAAATQELVASLKRAQQQKLSRFPAMMNRLTTLLSAWLCDMRAMPLPGVSASPAATAATSAKQSGPSTTTTTTSRGFIEHAVLLIQRGLLLARDVQFTMTNALTLLHATATTTTTTATVSMPTSFMDSVAHGVEMLMMVKEAFHAKSGVLASSFDILTRSIAFIIEKHLHTVHVALHANAGKAHGSGGDGRTSAGGLFSSTPSPPMAQAERAQLRAIEQAVLLLQRPLTPDSLLVLSLLLDVIANRRQLPVSYRAVGSDTVHAAGSSSSSGASGGLITSENRDSVFMAFAQLTRIMDYQVTLKEVTSCDFLYWHRETFVPRAFAHLYERPANASRLPYLAAALESATTSLVLSAKHTHTPQTTLMRPYRAFVDGCLHEQLLARLCTDIEDDLRLYTHGAVLGQPYRSLQRPTATATAAAATPPVVAKDLANFTRLAPFKLFGRWCDIAAAVEDHLDAQFYNLNALMPNDWKTYEEMRSLAWEKYGLSVAVGEGSLPGGIVDQGLDVLVITEDIQLFIAHYTYNLNEQLFIQRPTSTAAKHLHTLHMRHIANSIRTHGTGIMNTTVNYVYQCLLKKLSTLSRFLADDHVRSRLMKDQKRIATQRKELQGTGSTSSFMYPLSFAKQFNQEMRRLGLAEDGQTFLAKFARLVSEIGNALGYMRLIRSGGLRAIADSAQFLPQDAPRDEDKTSLGLARHLFLPRYLDDTDSSSSSSGDGDEEEEIESTSSSPSSPSGPSESESEKQARRAAVARRRRMHLATMEAVRGVDRVSHIIHEKLSDGSEYFSMLLDAISSRLGLPPHAASAEGKGGRSSPQAQRRRRNRRQGEVDEEDESEEESDNNDMGEEGSDDPHRRRRRRGRGGSPSDDVDADVERYAHLQLFYLIVPPMCLTFVESMIREKEQLMKKANDALFTDDGFALGCVFLLTLFGIQEPFRSLHFFKGTRESYVERLTSLHQTMMERQGLAERVAVHAATASSHSSSAADPQYGDNDAEEIHNMHLTASMLDITLREYAQLEEAFVASSVFFRADRQVAAARRHATKDDGDTHSTFSSSSASRQLSDDDGDEDT